MTNDPLATCRERWRDAEPLTESDCLSYLTNYNRDGWESVAQRNLITIPDGVVVAVERLVAEVLRRRDRLDTEAWICLAHAGDTTGVCPYCAAVHQAELAGKADAEVTRLTAMIRERHQHEWQPDTSRQGPGWFARCDCGERWADGD